MEGDANKIADMWVRMELSFLCVMLFVVIGNVGYRPLAVHSQELIKLNFWMKKKLRLLPLIHLKLNINLLFIYFATKMYYY